MFKHRAIVIQIAAIVAIFVCGIALGRWTTPDNKAVAPAPQAEATTRPAAAPIVTRVEKKLTSVASTEEAAKLPKTTFGSKKSLAEILKGPNSGNRTRELEEFATNIASSEIGSALKQLRRMPEGSARDLASGLLIAQWVDKDPENALKFASENREFDYIAGDVLQQMAADNMPAALARAKSITDQNARYQGYRGLLSYMADQDPMGALQLAGSVGSFPNGESLTQMIYRQWSQVDPQAAAARAAQDPPGEGWRSPVGQVLRTWANQDPLAAIAWSSSLPNSDSQARDIGQIIRQWSRNDMTAAANWVNTLPPGSTRDAAAAGLAFSVSGNDPKAAIGWAQTISDTAQRDNALQRLSREIVYRNPNDGAAILQAAGVPPNLIPAPPNADQGRGRRRGR